MINIKTVNMKFIKGDKVHVIGRKQVLTIDYCEIFDKLNYWFVDELKCAILETNLKKLWR
jgi:hypothetical protein